MFDSDSQSVSRFAFNRMESIASRDPRHATPVPVHTKQEVMDYLQALDDDTFAKVVAGICYVIDENGYA